MNKIEFTVFYLNSAGDCSTIELTVYYKTQIALTLQWIICPLIGASGSDFYDQQNLK